LYQQLISSESATLTLLRTGKLFFKEYPCKTNASETADCHCGLIESIPHFLFTRRRWAQQRTKLRQQHEDRCEDPSYALGGYSSRERGKKIDGPHKHWKPDISVVKATIQFAKDTGRLHPGEQDAAAQEQISTSDYS
ncbi:hypothetical protein K432DRAFT_310796, partial [Lepidopterella palustris CBS 459.81]